MAEARVLEQRLCPTGHRAERHVPAVLDRLIATPMFHLDPAAKA